jgi:predicted Rossmann fold nucleotide-binding protein DprA/Smf involved in DNA uptake
MGKQFEMLANAEVRAAYETVLGTARRHSVAVVGGPVLGGDTDACRKALDEGITVFSVGLDILGFRKFCEQMSSAVTSGLKGTSYSRKDGAQTPS